LSTTVPDSIIVGFAKPVGEGLSLVIDVVKTVTASVMRLVGRLTKASLVATGNITDSTEFTTNVGLGRPCGSRRSLTIHKGFVVAGGAVVDGRFESGVSDVTAVGNGRGEMLGLTTVNSRGDRVTWPITEARGASRGATGLDAGTNSEVMVTLDTGGWTSPSNNGTPINVELGGRTADGSVRSGAGISSCVADSAATCALVGRMIAGTMSDANADGDSSGDDAMLTDPSDRSDTCDAGLVGRLDNTVATGVMAVSDASIGSEIRGAKTVD
jgi:hypothetical protein